MSAKKKKKTVRKATSKHRSTSHSQGIERDFLIISGGGLLVIILAAMLFLG